jgi:hypothetical protein
MHLVRKAPHPGGSRIQRGREDDMLTGGSCGNQ